MRIRRKNNVTILSSSEILYFLKHGIPFQKPVIHDKHSGEGVLILIRELKQQRRRRLQTLSRLFQVVQFVKYWYWHSKRLYRSSGKDKESRCLEFFHFYVVVVQWRQRNVQKAWVLPFLPIVFFRRSRWRRRRRCLSFLMISFDGSARFPVTKKMGNH